MAVLLSILPAVLTALPNLVKAVESLFSGKPQSGTQKISLVQSLIQNAAPVVEAADPKYSQAIADLTTAVSSALVTFYNTVGEFTHTPAPAK